MTILLSTNFCRISIHATTKLIRDKAFVTSSSSSSSGSVGKMLYQMLVVQAFRADRLLAMASRFVATVMGESFCHSAEQELDLASIVMKEVRRRRRRRSRDRDMCVPTDQG